MKKPTVRRVSAATAAGWLAPRTSSAHKGSAGRVYVLAGSRGMAGAAVLAATGAVRSGAGLVRIGTVKSQQPVVARRAPLEVTSDALPEGADGKLSKRAVPAVEAAIKRFRPDVIAVGPGLGRSPGVTAVVKRLLFNGDVPVVVDADALNTLADLPPRALRAPAVLTPHPGEMARLLNWPARRVANERVPAAVSAARRFGAVALLKGTGTLVTDASAVWKNTSGNPAMASGGMGDVLTGIVAATWGQMPARDLGSGAKAAAFAAFVHGLAADIAVKDFPQRTLTASDVAAALPGAFKKLWRLKPRGGRR